MDVIRLRTYSRAGVSLGSLGLIVGGVLIYFGVDRFGDYLMIAGGAMLIVSALLLPRTPTGDQDAG